MSFTGADKGLLGAFHTRLSVPANLALNDLNPRVASGTVWGGQSEHMILSFLPIRYRQIEPDVVLFVYLTAILEVLNCDHAYMDETHQLSHK